MVVVVVLCSMATATHATTPSSSRSCARLECHASAAPLPSRVEDFRVTLLANEKSGDELSWMHRRSPLSEVSIIAIIGKIKSESQSETVLEMEKQPLSLSLSFDTENQSASRSNALINRDG